MAGLAAGPVNSLFGGGGSDWQRAGGIIPANVVGAPSLPETGGTRTLPAWLTLFSYMFLHGGVLHLLTNMAGLWVLGTLAEPVMGAKRFALTYLAFGAITGAVIVALVPYWTGPMVGASGAIGGVLGAFLARRYSEKSGRERRTIAGLLLEALPALAVVAWWVARDVPSEPDRAAAAAWHLVPFLLAWYGVRTWNGLGRPRRTRPGRVT